MIFRKFFSVPDFRNCKHLPPQLRISNLHRESTRVAPGKVIGNCSKSSPAEALVGSFETAPASESTDHCSKWPKRRTFLENREPRNAALGPILRIAPLPCVAEPSLA